MTNKELCERYPWLIPTNRWTGKIVDDYDYEYTELDSMPEGWRRAFGEQMCEEINEEIKTWSKYHQENFHITDIKEKWGFLHFYTNYGSDDLYKIIDKYEEMSKRICIHCGKPARWITRGWYMPVCTDHANEIFQGMCLSCSVKTSWEDEFIDINEYYKKED